MGKIFTNLSEASSAWDNGAKSVTWIPRASTQKQTKIPKEKKKGKESKKK